VEEMKLKLQKLDLIRNTTNAMIAQFDLHPKTNAQRKTSIRQKPIYSIAKKRTLQPLLHPSIQDDLSTNKFISGIESQKQKTKIDIGLKSNTVLNIY